MLSTLNIATHDNAVTWSIDLFVPLSVNVGAERKERKLAKTIQDVTQKSYITVEPSLMNYVMC